MEPSFWFGLAGDTLTFTGGLILALDALLKEREFTKSRKLTKTIESPFLAKVTLERNGISLKSEADVELAFIRISVRRAMYGSVTLCLGFVFLLVARLGEL
jgi:hypothetical protein